MVPKSTKYGGWQYFDNNSNHWVNITVQNEADPFHIVDELEEQENEELKKRHEEEKKNQEKMDQVEVNKYGKPKVMSFKNTNYDEKDSHRPDAGKSDHDFEKSYQPAYSKEDSIYPYYTNERMSQGSRYEEKQFIHDKYTGQLLNFVLLSPEHKIRFKLNGNRFWKRSTAMNDAFLGFMFWDQSNQLAPGEYVNSSSFRFNNNVVVHGTVVSYRFHFG